MPWFFSYLELFSFHSWHGMWVPMGISASLCLPWRHISCEASWIWCQTFQAVYQCKGNKILLRMASTFPVVLPFSTGLWSVTSLSAAICTTCLASLAMWKIRDVSPEEEDFKLAQECPPGFCAGTSNSCAVRIQPPEGGDTALVLGEPWRAASAAPCNGAGTAPPASIWALRGSWARVTRRLDKDGHYSSEYHGPDAAKVSRSILKMLSHAHFLVHQALVSTVAH